jgi:hypothetical protein
MSDGNRGDAVRPYDLGTPLTDALASPDSIASNGKPGRTYVVIRCFPHRVHNGELGYSPDPKSGARAKAKLL